MAENQRYRVIDRIDAGGMAEVFRGVAESLQGFKKNVAIKRVLPHLTKNKKFISMFLDEARLSLHLQHANVVSVFDIGVAAPQGDNPGAYFIVMEYVDGSNLKGIIESLRRQQRRMRVAHTLYLMMEVCKGLAYAHEMTDPETGRPLTIVHRDISPPNILISKNGEVKLVDFGLAKATSQLEQTDPGVVKGKFSYLSPEAALGKDVDRRADIFAVGILLYELLTGKRLFYGENDYQTIELVRQARVPSIGQQNADVDAELEAVVRRALARDVGQRFQTAGELHEALAQYLFSHGLKVTSRDIAQLVAEAVSEGQQNAPSPSPTKNLIDALINEEILKFTSLDHIDGETPSWSGDKPLSPEQLGGAPTPSGDGGNLVDTRAWAEDEDTGDGSKPLDLAPASSAGGIKHTITGPLPVISSTRDPRKDPSVPSVSSAPARQGAPVVESLEEILARDEHGAATTDKPATDAVNKARDATPAGTAEKATGAAGGATTTVRPHGKGMWIALALVMLLLVGGGGAALYYLKVLGH